VDLDCVCGLTASAGVSVMAAIHSARVCLIVFV